MKGGEENGMHAIEVEGVSKRFSSRRSDVWALKDVNLQVKGGEIFGLLGPNGAGKTTLLNTMVRLLTPDSGTVRILGRDVERDMGVLERVNFVSGDSKFHWVLTVEDVLHFYAASYRIPGNEREPRIRELVGFFDLERVRERKFAYLSTGERMRLIFAKAMLNRPEVLLLDEPTLGLDPSIAIRVRSEIARVSATFGTTILLTSHYMNEMEQLADRVAFIHRGEIVDVGTVAGVKRKQFQSYEAVMKVDRLPSRAFLKRHGFTASGTTLRRTLHADDDLGTVLGLLHKSGCRVLDVQTNKPTLEDYFVKILGITEVANERV